jgi:hypothetical protein
MNMIEKFIDQMDYARNDAIKSGIDPYHLPPPMKNVILGVVAILFISYIVVPLITKFMNDDIYILISMKDDKEEEIPLNNVVEQHTLKRTSPFKDDSDSDDESSYSNPPPLKRTRFEHMGYSLNQLLHLTVQLEDKDRSTNTPPQQFSFRIPLLPASPPSSDSE